MPTIGSRLPRRCAAAALLASAMLPGALASAGQSSITEAEGVACMGEDHSRKETQDMALADAKRKAAESVLSFVRSETTVKNLALEKDLIEAYTGAEVRLIGTPAGEWAQDAHMGDCYRLRVKAEVVPDEKGMKRFAEGQGAGAAAEDPRAPLQVRLWTAKERYRAGEKMKVYLKANKPFFGRVLYHQADGSIVQLLPNPYRSAAYFNGGTVYEVPSGEDRFDLATSAPFGKERLVVYASTAELGPIDLAPSGGVFAVSTASADVGVRTKGVVIAPRRAPVSGGPAGSDPPARATLAEFAEAESVVETTPASGP